jgi:hypothetical protein
MKDGSENSENTVQAGETLTNEEIPGWIEFSCWTMLVLTPVLYYVNGPAVSPDQLVVRTALVIVALIGAGSLSFRRWRMSRRCRLPRVEQQMTAPCQDRTTPPGH